MDGIEVECHQMEFKTIPRRGISNHVEITISVELFPNPESSPSSSYPTMTISLPFKYVHFRSSPPPSLPPPKMNFKEEINIEAPTSNGSNSDPETPNKEQRQETEAFFERLKNIPSEKKCDTGVQLQDEPRPFQRFCDMDVSKRYLRTENGSGEFVIGLHPDLKGVGHVEVRLLRKGTAAIGPRDCSQHLITYDQNGIHRENLRTHTPLHSQKGIFRLGVSKKAGRDFYSLKFLLPLQDGTCLVCETQNFRVSSNYQRKAKKEQ
eukprot:TRINITY_DN6982_c0_g2_i2.p1 TRINITY_DN6982_c0_g2~~TRINITY_DN6982_c0_g2_i2.p1  ORF type:complete len:264 (-),score=73.77 TRINITY_DN6982_c0_g2_i2:42-833(-)